VTLFASATKPPSIGHVPRPPESDLDRYHENLKQFRECERELADTIVALRRWYAARMGVDRRATICDGELFVKIGAMNSEPQLALLESNYRKVLARRAQLLARHAELSKLAGLSK
jgi:hypothetical protein